jgi:hypothetical protein
MPWGVAAKRQHFNIGEKKGAKIQQEKKTLSLFW